MGLNDDSLKDDWREHVLELHEQGLPREEIVAQVAIPPWMVLQIVDEAGRSFAEIDQRREHVLELHEQGMTRNEIAEQVPTSPWMVSKIVAEAGRSFASTSQSENARARRITKRQQARVAKALKLIPLAEQAFDAGNMKRALALSDTIHELLGFTVEEALLGLEKDPNWIAVAMGLPHS